MYDKLKMLKNQVETNLPTDWGLFKIIAYSEDENDWMPHIVLIHEKTNFNETVPVRFHSECLTGDIFHSKKCECGKQVQSNSLFYHRKSKAHILEMQKPENKDKKPDLKFFWREACEELNSKLNSK